MSIKHKGTNTIETVRLVLRRFRAEDAEAMFQNWAGDPLVCQYLSWGPHRDVDASLKRIIHWVANYEYDNFYVWAIELKSSHMPIGSISVEITNDKAETCEVGYCLGASYWNHGIMTEALRSVMHYLYYEIGYRMIQAKHDVLNPASGRVMKKAGMRMEMIEYNVGLRRDGTYYDCAVYRKYRGGKTEWNEL